MKNKSGIIASIAITASLIASVGCSAAQANLYPATRTAQAGRSQELATRMAIKVLATLTADARITMSDEPTQANADDLQDQEAQLATQEAASRIATLSAQSTQNVLQAEARQVLLNEAMQWPVLLSDSFEQNANGWPVGTETDSLADIAWSNPEGTYRWEAVAKDSFVWWAVPDLTETRDFYLSAEIKQLNGPDDAESGIVFRQNGESDFYLFEINGQGQFSLYLHSMDQWESLLPWIGTSVLKQGEANRLGVIARGPELLLMINDEFLAEVRDSRLENGSPGLLVGLSNAGDAAAWEFDNFELRAQETNPTAEGTLTPDWYGTPTLDSTSVRLLTTTTTPLPPLTERRNIYNQNH